MKIAIEVDCDCFFCGECDHLRKDPEGYICYLFDTELDIDDLVKDVLRTQKCLDAEIKESKRAVEQFDEIPTYYTWEDLG